MSWCIHDNIRSQCEFCNPHLVEERRQRAEEKAQRRRAKEAEERRQRELQELKRSAMEELFAEWRFTRNLLGRSSFLQGVNAFTGGGPFHPESPEGLLGPRRQTMIINEDEPLPVLDQVRLVVIGEDAWSDDLISELARYNPAVRFLPQPAFIDELLFGNDWWLSGIDMLEEMAEWHQGLQFVLEVRGRFGPLALPAAQGGPGGLAGRLSPHSFLSEMGYSVAANGPPESVRRGILARAVAEYGRSTVEWLLQGFIDMASRRERPPRVAIERWRADLLWVRGSFEK